MTNYIDSFVLPIPRAHLNDYKKIAQQVAEIWKEHGALAYYEFVGDDVNMEGTRSFAEMVNATENEAVIFGWTVFKSKNARDIANKRVPADPRMTDLVAPLTDPSNIIFDPSRMVYGGFQPLVYTGT